MTRTGIALLVAVLVATGVRAEGLPSILSEEGQAFLVGLRAVEGDTDPEPTPRTQVRKGKSSKRSFLLSALVPGLGQWYAGSKKRGLAFLGAEAALVGMWAAWKGKGNDLEEEFRAVADEHWEPEATTWFGATRRSRKIRPLRTRCLAVARSSKCTFRRCGSRGVRILADVRLAKFSNTTS